MVAFAHHRALHPQSMPKLGRPMQALLRFRMVRVRALYCRVEPSSNAKNPWATPQGSKAASGSPRSTPLQHAGRTSRSLLKSTATSNTRPRVTRTSLPWPRGEFESAFREHACPRHAFVALFELTDSPTTSANASMFHVSVKLPGRPRTCADGRASRLPIVVSNSMETVKGDSTKTRVLGRHARQGTAIFARC